MEKKKSDTWKKQKNNKKGGKRHYGRPGCDREDNRESKS